MTVPAAVGLRYRLWPDAERFLNDASVGGVDDQHGRGPAQDVAGHRIVGQHHPRAASAGADPRGELAAEATAVGIAA
jgi:hypothetical protein